mmetsp:Transcript_72604/g.210155  ORF Transcript_72604/g.210155 Transcript_72604/m.210155 type:complete len:292 (-) Transcript_72604:555-1430(-)
MLAASVIGGVGSIAMRADCRFSGNDSPVMAELSIKEPSVQSRMRTSAGTRLPASNNMTSPGRRSSGGNCRGNAPMSCTWRNVATLSAPCMLCKAFIVASACCSVHHWSMPEEMMTIDKIAGVTRSSPPTSKARKSSTTTQSQSKTLKTPPNTCRVSNHNGFGFFGGVIALRPNTRNFAESAASSRPHAKCRLPSASPSESDKPGETPPSMEASSTRRTSRKRLDSLSSMMSNSMACATFRTAACLALNSRTSSALVAAVDAEEVGDASGLGLPTEEIVSAGNGPATGPQGT